MRSLKSQYGRIQATRCLPSIQPSHWASIIAHTISGGCLGEAPCSSHSPKSIHFPSPSMPAPGSFQLSLASAASGHEGAAHLIPDILQCKNKTPLQLGVPTLAAEVFNWSLKNLVSISRPIPPGGNHHKSDVRHSEASLCGKGRDLLLASHHTLSSNL